MTRIALTTFRRTPQLSRCEPRSILGAVLQAAQFGWEISVHCYLVPYKNERTGTLECQLIPGWRGLVDLASRSGRASVWTGAVYEGDEFEFALGDSPHVRHVPLALEETVEKLTHVYAIGRTTGSTWPVVEVWPMAKVRAHRDRYNRQGDRHYSFQHLEMYGRKCALLQVLKYMPQSAELQTAVELDHDGERGEQHLRETLVDVPPADDAETVTTVDSRVETRTVAARIKDQLKNSPGTKKSEEIWPKKEKDEKEPPPEEKLPF